MSMSLSFENDDDENDDIRENYNDDAEDVIVSYCC